VTKRPKLESTTTNSIAQNLTDSAYQTVGDLIQDVHKVSQELLKPLQEKDSKSIPGSMIQPSHLSKEEASLWAGVLAFKKVLQRVASNEIEESNKAELETSENEEVNGVTEEDSEIIIKGEDDTPDLFNAGQSVLTIFANTQGAPKQLFSSFQNPVKVGDSTSEAKELDDSVEVILPLKESSLPNFISITKVPTALDGQKSKSRQPTFGERFAPPRNITQIQPPKPSNKLLTKSSNVTWISAEALSRQRNERSYADRVYNWCSTRLSSGSWLAYNGVEVPKEPASPEEKRRQRDRALSTGAPQPTQSEETIRAIKKAKDDALFRSAFSSFAPSRDNSGAIIPDIVKTELWWMKTGSQRAQRVFSDTTTTTKDEKYEIDHDEEDKLFKDAVENIDPALLEVELESTKHEADKEIDDLLQDISELIETLYSYQRIRNSNLPSNSTPMTPVGQRNALTEMIGTPSAPSTAENEVYKLLKSQLGLLILQLPPSALSRLNGDKLEKLNIKTDIIVEMPDEAGTLEDDTPKQPSVGHVSHGQQQVAPRGPVSGGYNLQSNQYGRSHQQQGVHTPGMLSGVGPRQAYYPQQQAQRTPSAPYNRQTSGIQTYAAGYPSTGPRPGYNQTGFNQASYGQSPSRMNYSQSSQYYQQVQQAAGKANFTGFPSGTPHTGIQRYVPQTPISYNRTPSGQYGHASVPPVQSPHYPQATPTATPPQFNRAASNSVRPAYFQSQASAASGPTGFHTSMTAQEQQLLMDRQRAQIAAQTQARLAAMGQTAANMPSATAASSYTTPSREGSGTPRPITATQGDQISTIQANGTG
jgi:hypothetical protein